MDKIIVVDFFWWSNIEVKIIFHRTFKNIRKINRIFIILFLKEEKEDIWFIFEK